jgi:hypothetical protein
MKQIVVMEFAKAVRIVLAVHQTVLTAVKFVVMGLLIQETVAMIMTVQEPMNVKTIIANYIHAQIVMVE